LSKFNYQNMLNHLQIKLHNIIQTAPLTCGSVVIILKTRKIGHGPTIHRWHFLVGYLVSVKPAIMFIHEYYTRLSYQWATGQLYEYEHSRQYKPNVLLVECRLYREEVVHLREWCCSCTAAYRNLSTAAVSAILDVFHAVRFVLSSRM
jgi:hypothetical protein